MVAAWLDPEVVNHVVLVFIGEQGVYKSTWFNHLPPPALKRYYTIKFDSTNLNKDDLLLLSENIMVCLEEIDTMSDRVANFFKATITATSTNIRAAYGRYAEQRVHVASYCGTGNNPQFLNEAVSRRWLPFIVKQIVSPLEQPFNHAGIFAQALALYRSGFRYWFNTEEIKVLNRHNRNFQAPCLEEELIAVCFRKPGPSECGQFFPTSLVLKYIADNIGSKLSAIKVGRAMKDLGYELKKRKGMRGWICIPLNSEEMVAERKRIAMASGGRFDEEEMPPFTD
jgi:predicted P-loop ATPase